MSSCDYCGRLDEGEDGPHPSHDECPYREDHKSKNGDDTLLEAIQKTEAGDSVSLYAWGSAYPNFRTVFETRTILPGVDGDDAEVDNSYFRKVILATSDTDDTDNYYRLEYDPSKESLIEYSKVTPDEVFKTSASFGIFLRSSNPDVSYFGSSLPG